VFFYIFAVDFIPYMNRLILGIESSCDDTSASVLLGNRVLSNVTNSQVIHERYGGVVPELASRAHQQNIIPVVDRAIKDAQIDKKSLDAIAFTCGPGLLGSLLVGTSFAKSFSLALEIPMIAVNHMQAHVLAHFIDHDNQPKPTFPFLCLTVSGGHTQIVLVKDHLQMEILGTTLDDAAGEAFDKTAKLLGFPYPGGAYIDRQAQLGNSNRFQFSQPKVAGYNYSFSGLKTSILYFLQKQTSSFIQDNLADLCASIQATIIQILLFKLKKAASDLNIQTIAIAGGVSANSGLREAIKQLANELKGQFFIPKFDYCTDNAAMIALTGQYMYEKKLFADQHIVAQARMPLETYLSSKER